MSDEYKNLRAVFEKWREIQESSTSGSVTVFLSTRKPLRINYQIGTFDGNREFISTKEEKERLEEKIRLFGGMYSTFDFDAFGKAQIGNEVFNALLTVNNLDSADYINHAKEGGIGVGCLRGGELLFRIHISPSMVKDILFFRSKIESNAASYSSFDSTDTILTMNGDYSLSPLYGFDSSLGVSNPFLIIRLDIELKDLLNQDPPSLGYSIKRLYM
jgi:hypothetical protein